MPQPMGPDHHAPSRLGEAPGGERLSVLIRHIVHTHHALTRSEAPIQRELAVRVMRMHEAEHLRLAGVAELVHVLFDDLAAHMEREEYVLFPYIEALEAACDAGLPMEAPFGSVRGLLRHLGDDHDTARSIMLDIEQLTNGFTPPPGASESWVLLYDHLRAHHADLQRQFALENDVLFPRAIALEQSGRA